MEWNAMDVQDPYDYDYSFDRRSRYCRRMYRAVEWRKVSKWSPNSSKHVMCVCNKVLQRGIFASATVEDKV